MKDPIQEAADKIAENLSAQPPEEEKIEESSEEEEIEESEDELPSDEGEEETEEESEDQPLPSIEPPASWSAAQKESWDSLPPDTQQTIVDRERQRDGYLYQKTNELATQQQEAERLVAETKESRDRYKTQLESQTAPSPPDPQMLNSGSDRYDRDEYDRLMAVFLQAEQSHKTRDAEIEKINAEQKQESARDYETFNANRASELQREWPELLDPSTGQQTWQDLATYAQTRGIGPEQLRIAAAQELLILEESRKYRELMAKAPKTAKKLKTVKPGTSVKRKPDKTMDREKARKSFARNPVGNRAAAVALLMKD